jgi:hypothetical protein
MPSDARFVTLYTDASDTGWGVVVFYVQDGTETQAESQESINVRELRALRIGLRILVDVFNASAKSPIVVSAFIDNTSALQWYKKGHSRSFVANGVLNDCQREFDRVVVIRFLQYVASAANFADAPSRRTYPDNCVAVPAQ